MEVNFRKTTFAGVCANIKDCPKDGMPEVVLSGKSNVGKSSLVNALADNKKLARVSQTPGKTREVIYFNVDGKFYLTDLPGYGYARVSKEKAAKFSKLCDDYFISGRPISLVLHLVDIRHDPSALDIAMIKYMNETGLPYFLIFTKCDKLSRAQTNKRISEMGKSLEFTDRSVVFAVSSSKKEGLEDLKTAIADYLFEQ